MMSRPAMGTPQPVPRGTDEPPREPTTRDGSAQRSAGVRALTAAAGTLLSAFLLFILLRHTDWAEVSGLLRGAQPAWLLLGLTGLALTVWARATMWRVLLEPVASVGAWQATRALVFGLTVNNLLPLRMGEAVRAGVVSTTRSCSLVAVLATIVAETLTSAVLLVGLGGLALLRTGSFSGLDRLAPWILGVSLAGLTILALLARRRSRPGARGPGALLDRVSRGSRALASPLAMTRAVLWGVLALAGQMLLLAGVQRALGLALPWDALAMTVAAMALAGALPSAPAAMGTLELGAMGALALYDVPHAAAVGTTLLFHVLMTVPVTVTGVLLMARAGLRPDRLRELATRDSRTPGRDHDAA